MRIHLLALAAATVLAAPISAFAHGVELTMDQVAPVSAGTVHLSFILQSADGEEITDQELTEVHEKKLHFQIFDQALSEYRHVHPEYSTAAQRWVVDADLPINGNYRLWAEGTLADDGDEFTASAKLVVTGGLQANAIPSGLGDHRSGANEVSVATLSDTVFHAGRMVMPTLTLSRSDGQPAVITPYLGAPAHVTATPMSAASLVHVHPMPSSPTSTELMLHLTFAKAGDHRVWVEFVEGGLYRLVPLSVTVLP
jgi:hypothetical protein